MTAAPLAIGAGEDVLARLLAAPGDAVTAVIAAPAGEPERALLRAVVTLAAARRAPGARVNAVLAGPAAAPVAMAEAVAFLAGATATTGQTIDLG